MKSSHSRDEIFARLLVDAGDQIRILQRQLPEQFDKPRQVTVELWLYSNRHDRFSDVVDSFERDDLLDRRDRLSRLHVFETEKCWNVSRAELSYDFSLWTHVNGYLL